MIQVTATSIFDWDGPSFLAFYAVAFCLTTAWSIARRKKVVASFNPAPGTTPQLDDPIEIAYLSGGPSRAAQVAVLNLVEKGALSWQPASTFRKAHLKQAGPIASNAHWFERSIYSAVLAMGETGLPLTKLGPSVLNGIFPLESRLAKLGLRPTKDERSRRMSSAPLPLWGLLVVGGLKLFIGLSREMPVGFLVLAIITTLITIIIIQNSVGKLSPAGKKLLTQLREKRNRSSLSPLTHLALFGISGSAAHAGLAEVDASMMKEVQKMSHTRHGSNGCGGGGFASGCGSGDGGCGGGGCGGGGCGGCSG